MHIEELTLESPESPELESDNLYQCSPETFEEHVCPSLLDPPETTSTDNAKLTFRGRFMQGKVEEYKATVSAYEEIYGTERYQHHDDYGPCRPRKIEALENCRTLATMQREKKSGELTVFGSACHDRWCPMCAAQKADYATEQTQDYIDTLKAPRFLTLTLRHDKKTLKEQIDFLQDSFRRLRQRVFWKNHVTGGIWFLQIKRGKNSGCWHPHLHILLDGAYLEQGKLSELWEQITYGSPVVDIRRIHNKKAAAQYVARYVARPAVLKDMSMPDRVEVIKALHGKRLCGTFGTAKAITLTPPKETPDGEWEEISYYDTILHQAKTNEHAAKILQKYWANEPLPEKDYILYLESIGRYIKPKEIPKKPHQYTLDFYKKAG